MDYDIRRWFMPTYGRLKAIEKFGAGWLEMYEREYERNNIAKTAAGSGLNVDDRR